MKVFSETYIQGDRVSVDGIKVLGTPIGHEGLIDAFLKDQMQRYPLFLPRLRMMDPQMACRVQEEIFVFLPRNRLVAKLTGSSHRPLSNTDRSLFLANAPRLGTPHLSAS